MEEILLFPNLSVDSFNLIAKRYRIRHLKYQEKYKELLKTKKNVALDFTFPNLTKFSSGNRYNEYRKYQKSEFHEESSVYLKHLTDLLIALEIRNYLRAENFIEKLINLDPRRLTFEVLFDKEATLVAQKLLKKIDFDKIESKKISMFLSLLKGYLEVPDHTKVFDSLQELRFQLKSFLGRNYPLYFLKTLKKQISQKELTAYAQVVLANVEESFEPSVETLLELLKRLPRNKTVMKKIVMKLGDFNSMTDYESFLVLSACENEVFRRYIVENLKNCPKAKFQIERKILLKLLLNPKTSSFALGRLWSMGDKNQSLIWDSVSIIN